MPVPGRVVDHPSVLLGTIEEIAADAERLTALDHVTGLDLLAYRHPTADHLAHPRGGPALERPGDRRGVDREHRRVLAVSEAGAWGYTIGSAIFDGLLPGAPSIADQVRHVLEETAQSSADPSRDTRRRLEECPAERCSPTGCATSCWRKSPVRSCSRGRSCRARANSPSASRCLVPRCVTRCVRLSRPGTLSVVAVRAAMSPSVAAWTGLDTELPRDDRECGRPCRDARPRSGVRECSKDDGLLQLSLGDTVLAVERVRTADDRPVIYSHDRIPARLLRTDLDLRNLDPRCSRC